MFYTSLKKKKFASVTCNGNKFHALKIFNVVNENEVISNLNLTFTYIKFHKIFHIKFNKKCTKPS